MKIVVINIAVVALLTGCAAGTVKDLKSDPANSIRVQIDQNYQRVYKNLLERMQECMGEGWVGVFAQNHIRHAMYSELQEANISFVMSNLGYQNHYLHVDIKALEQEKTKLEAFVYFSTWRSALGRIEAWARDTNATCNVAPLQSMVPEK